MTSRVDADWVMGELRGKKGMFPLSFVDKVPENLPQDGGDKKSDSQPQAAATKPQPQAAATKQVNTCEISITAMGV